MSDFSKVFNGIAKDLAKDANADIFEAGDVRILSHVPCGIPTRQPMLDLCISKDGIPVGKVVEFYGGPGCGKTTASYHIIAETQRRGGGALFIDTEQSFDLERAIECGCTEKDLDVVSAESIDAIFRAILSLISNLEKTGFSKDVVVVVDSITAVTTEFDLSHVQPGGQSRPGEEARAIKAGLKRVVPKLARLKVPLIMITHILKDPSVKFGSNEKSGGGFAIKYFAALRCKFTKTGEAYEGLKKDNERTGHKVLVAVEKLKGAQQKRFTYETRLLNRGGFDYLTQLRDAFVHIGMLKDKGRKIFARLDPVTGEELDAFHEDEWEGIVDDKGGFLSLYKVFIDQAVERGFMRKWGT